MKRTIQCLVCVGTLVIGVIPCTSAQPAKLRFEVASVKPTRELIPTPPGGPARPALSTTFRLNAPLANLVQRAYGLFRSQLVGGPAWIREDRFEIEARASRPSSENEMMLMLQTLIAERFQLVLRKDVRDMRFVSLTFARADRRLGPQLTKCDPAYQWPASKPSSAMGIRGFCQPMCSLLRIVANVLEAPVADETGLTGQWTYRIRWSEVPGAAADTPEFTTAIQQQLGLKATTRRGPRDVLVVESVNRPSPN